jgi:hypothetical protein
MTGVAAQPPFCLKDRKNCSAISLQASSRASASTQCPPVPVVRAQFQPSSHLFLPSLDRIINGMQVFPLASLGCRGLMIRRLYGCPPTPSLRCLEDGVKTTHSCFQRPDFLRFSSARPRLYQISAMPSIDMPKVAMHRRPSSANLRSSGDAGSTL